MNCRGLGNQAKRRDVFHFLKSKKYSVYCLQDVHFDKEMENIVKNEWGPDCYFSSFKSNARGVATLFNNNFEYKVKNVKTDCNGNMLVLDLEIGEYSTTLINLYGPNTDDPNFYSDIATVLSDMGNTHNILCGDWNLILNNLLDCVNYTGINNPLARKRVLEMCSDLDLVDVWRIHNPHTQRFTWRHHKTLKQSRLDFFLLSSELQSKLLSCDIKPGYRTDHSIIDITLDLTKIERGSGYWKFNNSLLMDKNYSVLVRNVLSDLVDEYAVSPYLLSNVKNIHSKDIQFTINDQTFFEMLLMKIRSKTISYSTWKKKEFNKLEGSLERDIGILSNKVAEGDNESIDLLSAKQADLVDVRKIKMDGVLIRSRTRWMECGEKPSKYFLNMEKT